jgi:FtsH-binding integral membrane protein
MITTLAGIFAGATFAFPLISSGWVFLLLLAEFALIFSSRAWVRSSPLNYVLFLLFPFFSGLTITPFLMSVVTGYVNGATILLNASIATVLMTASSAVIASMTKDLGSTMGRFLFHSLIGLVVFGLLQLFIPALRSAGIEMIVSGAGIVIFGLFLAYDIQRLSRDTALGQSPFLLALSLYLDIFNLFLYVVRFMLATSGRRG